MNILGINLEENLADINLSELLQYVSPAKQKRIQSFKFQQDAARVLIGDILVRAIVCKYLNRKNDEIQFSTNLYGKPYVHGAEGFHYNISHSGSWVVCAVDSKPVGIDVEVIIPIDLDIMENLFLAEEVKYIMDCPESERTGRFYEVWTLKESYFKGLGCGLLRDIKSVSLKNLGKANITVLDSTIHKRFLHLCKLDQEYCLAVCTCHNKIPDRVSVINLQEIMIGM